MKIQYSVIIFVIYALFNYSFADTDLITKDTDFVTKESVISIQATIQEYTCTVTNENDLTKTINFDSFTEKELIAGKVTSKKMKFRVVCGNSSFSWMNVTMIPGPFGYYNDDTLLTDNEAIGINIRSDDIDIVINDEAFSGTEIHRNFDSEISLEFTPVYIPGKEVKTGVFESSMIIELKYY